MLCGLWGRSFVFGYTWSESNLVRTSMCHRRPSTGVFFLDAKNVTAALIWMFVVGVACYVKRYLPKTPVDGRRYVDRYLPLLFFQLVLHWITLSRLVSSDSLICIKLTFGKLLNALQKLERQRHLPECFADASVTV